MADIYVSSGVTSSGVVVSSYDSMYILNGGVASRTTVYSEGALSVENGGVADIVFAASGATIVGWKLNLDYYLSVVDGNGIHDIINSAVVIASARIGSGGMATSTSVNSDGHLLVLNGGMVNSTIVDTGGRMSVEDGGAANNTIVNTNAYMYISSGGVANHTSVYEGNLSIGGVANRTTVNAYGAAFIESGGVAKHTTVGTDGNLYITNGGMLSGSLKIISGGSIFADPGAIIDFTVAEQQNAWLPLINDWNLISGGADALYTLTVEADQEDGLYILATGASGFSNSVTVKTTENKTLGTISVGETKTFGNTDYTLSLTGDNLALIVIGGELVKSAKSDVDGNGVSDIVFQWTGNNYQIGFWMNGTNDWQSQGGNQPQDWELIGAYDMDQNGKADIVMRGNIQIGSDKGAYIGYYADGDVTNWQNISYLNNPNDIDWHLAIGNITGNEGCNSLVWYSPELGALGVWTDGTDNWVGLNGGYDYSWTLEGCGDFNGDGKDDILFSHDGNLYCTDIDNNFRSLGGWGTDWKVCTTGDFSGDGTDDIIVQNGNMVVKFKDGLAENWMSLGVLDAEDWFIVGAGDYNGDQAEDLLVRQYSTGMLGYYSGGDMDKWVEVGRGVDMNWTVIAGMQGYYASDDMDKRGEVGRGVDIKWTVIA